MRFRSTAMITSVASAALSIGSLLLASPASANEEPSTPTVICHGTGSERHPYVVIPPALASLEEGHDDDIRLDDGTLLRPLHPEDEGYDSVDCGTDDSTVDPVVETPIDPQGADPVPDTPIDPQGADPVPDTPIEPQGEPTEPTTPVDAEGTETQATTVEDAVADEESGTGLVPAGAVEAGDGSAAGGGSGNALPYVLGSLALAGAGGAAVAARRSARESD